MWFFVDECWLDNPAGGKAAVLGGLLITEEFASELDKALYRIRKKYFGIEHAKNPDAELKASNLLSNSAFRLKERHPEQEIKNIRVVEDVLGFLIRQKETDPTSINVFASIVKGTSPQLICPDPKSIPRYFAQLVRNVSAATIAHDAGKITKLIFDQRFNAQKEISVGIKGFVKGLGVSNIHPVPYFGSSHASAPIQTVDIITHIIAKRKIGRREFIDLYDMVEQLQWRETVGSKTNYGIRKYTE